jgi:hypothetical protein
MFLLFQFWIMRTKHRLCLVTYTVAGKWIKWNVLWWLEPGDLEGLNLMLNWRKFLHWLESVEEKDINILSYVELHKSQEEELIWMEDALNMK